MFFLFKIIWVNNQSVTYMFSETAVFFFFFMQGINATSKANTQASIDSHWAQIKDIKTPAGKSNLSWLLWKHTSALLHLVRMMLYENQYYCIQLEQQIFTRFTVLYSHEESPLTNLISSHLRGLFPEGPAVTVTLLNLLIFWVQVQLTFGMKPECHQQCSQ